MHAAVKALLAFAGLVCGPLAAQAQAYPTRSITIVVPLVAGSGMDTVTRLYADELSKSFGKPVLVENQPGAALMLAAQNVAKAEPDGHTLLVSATTVMTAIPALTRKFNFDPDKDFVPISLYVDSAFVLIVSSKLNVTDMKGFVALAKSRSASPLAFATTGTAGLPHLIMESLKHDLGFAANHVPYRNTGQIISDVVGGHLDSSMSEIGAALALIREGKLQALGITARSRHPGLPSVAPLAETAGRPGFDAVAWHILVAPSQTPRPIVDRLTAEMHRIISSAAFKEKVLTAGLVPRPPVSGPEMIAYVKAERERWGSVIKRLGLDTKQ